MKWEWMEEVEGEGEGEEGEGEVFVWCFWFSYNISSFVCLCCFGSSIRSKQRQGEMRAALSFLSSPLMYDGVFLRMTVSNLTNTGEDLLR